MAISLSKNPSAREVNRIADVNAASVMHARVCNAFSEASVARNEIAALASSGRLGPVADVAAIEALRSLDKAIAALNAAAWASDAVESGVLFNR